MNIEAALIYLAVGSLSKLVTLRYPTPGERVGTIAEIVGGASVAGLLIPPGDNAGYFVVIPFIAACLGEWLSRFIDYARVKYDETNRRGAYRPQSKRGTNAGHGAGQGNSV